MEIDDQAEDALRYRAKAVLRQRARALRNTIPTEALSARSGRIVLALLALPALARARSAALFWPIEGRNEVDLRPLDAELRARGTRIAYPSIDEARVMTFRWTDDPVALEERGFGFREPVPGALEVDRLDAVIVPALQLDPRGHRLGYGAGFYDRTLPRFCPPAIAIGVGFDFQLIAEVPITEGDVAVDIVVTDARVVEVG
jgi:5-formyltetrahydrofolate cyclo-ligase